jgi:hypothetical protein
MKQSLLVLPIIALLALLLPSSASAARIAPQTQMFHQSIAGQSFPTDANGVLAPTTIATQSFTTNQDGAVSFTLLQTVNISSSGGGPSFSFFTITVTLDGQPIYDQTTTFSGDIDAIVTSTAPVVAGTHTLAITYAVRASPSNPYTVTTDPGTLSLIVATPATSN